jgi:hypothetical protein
MKKKKLIKGSWIINELPRSDIRIKRMAEAIKKQRELAVTKFIINWGL